jgi:hypothetical protein
MPRYGFSVSVLIVFSTLLSGCRLGSYEDYRLGVPYRQQEQDDYCVPASVLMWRLYDGLPAVSQTTIYNWLGGQACNPTDVPSAVSYFTNTFDTYLDIVFSPSQLDREELVARQITAEDRQTPVIAIVGSARDHVGVINGGRYTKQGSYYEWEFLYFHDPKPGGQNSYYSARQWMDFFCRTGYGYCGQILSASAASGWQNYYSSYGDSVLLYGGGESCLPRDCGPYEN